MKDINWNAVHGFWLAAEGRLFLHAAQAFPQVSAQALHKRVRQLEAPQNLDLKLLKSRGIRDLELTEAGRRLHRLVAPMFQSFETLAAELRGEDGGVLRLAVPSFIAHHHAAEIIHRFAEGFPRVSIGMYVREYSRILAMVESGTADLALCPMPAEIHDLEVRTLGHLRCEILAPRHHRLCRGRVRWADVVREPLILPEPAAMLRQAFEELLRRKHLYPRLQVSGELTTPALAADAVRAGLGVALVVVGPRAAETFRDLARIPVPPGLRPIELALFYRKRRYLPRYMHAFMEIAAAMLRDAAPSGGRRR